jgi:hypothetical protein
MTQKHTGKFLGGHRGGVIRDGAAQHTSKPTTSEEQAAKRKAAQAAKKPSRSPAQYTEKSRVNHAPSDIKLRSKSHDLIDSNGTNEATLQGGICSFVNMEPTTAFTLLVEAIYQKDNGYNFIQEKLGITIPNPEKNFHKLLKELASQFRHLNNQKNFFKESYLLPEQEDNPITIAYNSIQFGQDKNGENIETTCARLLVPTACEQYIASHEGRSIGNVWYFLMAIKNDGYNFGGLVRLFSSICQEEDECKATSNWLLPLHTQIFNLFKAILAQEKPDVYEKLSANPSHFQYQDESAVIPNPPERDPDATLPFHVDNLPGNTISHKNVAVEKTANHLTFEQMTNRNNFEAFGRFLESVDSIRAIKALANFNLSKVLKSESRDALTALFDASSNITAIFATPTLSNIASNINAFETFKLANIAVGNALHCALDSILDNLDAIKAFVDAAVSIETALNIDSAEDILNKEPLIRMNIKAASEMN